jgi:hypothetical protein
MGETRTLLLGGMSVMRLLLLALPLLAAGCATKVYNPNKTAAEQAADIRYCSAEANRKYWMDSIAALYNAYDCLEARGYSRDQNGLGAQLDRALGGAPATKPGPVLPCAVPCRRPG